MFEDEDDERSSLFPECVEGHPDDHWTIEPLCQATGITDPYAARRDGICGRPLSNFEHNESPAFDADSAALKHEFVAPTVTLVWGENAWRTNACPSVKYASTESPEHCICWCHASTIYVNSYLTDRQYGGPEEGGWWYDTGEPVESVRFEKLRDAEAYREIAEAKFPATKSRYSMAPREDDFTVCLERGFARPWPISTPRYE